MGVLKYEGLRGLVLVGRSHAGSIITAVAARAAERLARLVYLDAFVPKTVEAYNLASAASHFSSPRLLSSIPRAYSLNN